MKQLIPKVTPITYVGALIGAASFRDGKSFKIILTIPFIALSFTWFERRQESI